MAGWDTVDVAEYMQRHSTSILGTEMSHSGGSNRTIHTLGDLDYTVCSPSHRASMKNALYGPSS